MQLYSCRVLIPLLHPKDNTRILNFYFFWGGSWGGRGIHYTSAMITTIKSDVLSSPEGTGLHHNLGGKTIIYILDVLD